MKKTFYLFNPGMLERKDNTLKFTPCADDGERPDANAQSRYLPVEDISEFYVFGSLRANSALFNFLGQKDIAMHFFDYYENYTGSFMPRDSLLSGKMLLAQTSHYQNQKKRMAIARKFIEGAAYNMVKNLQYYNRRGKDMEDIMELMNKLSAQIPDMQTTEELMGIEGQIRQYGLLYDLSACHSSDSVESDHQLSAQTGRTPLFAGIGYSGNIQAYNSG